MSYCPKCGRKIMDESLGCPICGVNENTVGVKSDESAESVNEINKETAEEVKAEKVEDFTVEDSGSASTSNEVGERTEPEAWESYSKTEPKPRPENTQPIPTVIKVLVILGVIIVGGIGSVAGIIAGIILMKSPIEDNQKFGKTLLIVSCVMMGLWLLCCLVGGFFGLIGNIAYIDSYY